MKIIFKREEFWNKITSKNWQKHEKLEEKQYYKVENVWICTKNEGRFWRIITKIKIHIEIKLQKCYDTTIKRKHEKGVAVKWEL